MKSLLKDKLGSEKTVGYILWGFIIAWVLFLGLRDIIDGDIWFHIAGGRFTWVNFRPPATDPFTFTSSHRPYVTLQWLFQLLVYAFYSGLGIKGLIFLKTAILILLVLLLIKALDLKSAFGSAMILILIIAGCSATVTIRPLLLSLVYLVLLLYVWQKKQKYWLLPLTMLFWVNTHGLFVMGLFVIGAWSLEAPRKRLWWLLASIMSCFLNPYGIKGVMFPLLLFTRIGEQNVYSTHIQEFTSALNSRFYLHHLAGWACLMLAIIAAWSLLKARSRLSIGRWAALSVLFAGFAFIYFLALRNMPLFAIVAGWIIIQSFPALKHWQPARIRQGILLIVPVLLVIIALYMRPRIHGYPELLHRHHAERGFGGLASYAVPSGAVQFLQSHEWQGRMFNDFNWGGYLLFNFPKGKQIFIDPRLEVHSKKLFSDYVMMTERPDEFLDFDAEYDFDIALFCHFPFRGLPALFEVLKRHEEWTLVYADEIAAIFCKDRPVNKGLLANTEIIAADSVGNNETLREKYLHDLPALNFLQTPSVNELYSKIGRGQIALFTGEINSGIGKLLEAALQAPDVGDTHFLLAVAALRANDRALFLRAVDLLWTIQPRHPELKELMLIGQAHFPEL